MFHFLRKLYLRIYIFIYSIRHILNKITLTVMIIILSYAFVDKFIFMRVIVPLANSAQIKKEYKQAIEYYQIAHFYYTFNHFSEDNKKEYFDTSYQIAACYLKEGEKRQSINTMIDAITTTQNKYGIFSWETAYFLKKYLIEYYLTNNNILLAKQEFRNLLTIQSKLGYTNNEMSDIIRISGDIAYQEKQYDLAIGFYEKAYNIISSSRDIDYAIFQRIIERIGEYELKNNSTQNAILIYKSSIKLLETSPGVDNEVLATLYINLGNIYNRDDKQLKDAISCYEQALANIKKLPKANYLKQNRVYYMNALKDMYNRDGQYHKSEEIDVELARLRRFAFL